MDSMIRPFDKDVITSKNLLAIFTKWSPRDCHVVAVGWAFEDILFYECDEETIIQLVDDNKDKLGCEPITKIDKQNPTFKFSYPVRNLDILPYHPDVTTVGEWMCSGLKSINDYTRHGVHYRGITNNQWTRTLRSHAAMTTLGAVSILEKLGLTEVEVDDGRLMVRHDNYLEYLCFTKLLNQCLELPLSTPLDDAQLRRQRVGRDMDEIDNNSVTLLTRKQCEILANGEELLAQYVNEYVLDHLIDSAKKALDMDLQ